MDALDPRYAGRWPDLRPLVRRELAAYLVAVESLDPGLPTRCPPWTVRDVTRHLAATFARFGAMLRQGRAGDLSPPFAPDALAGENLRAVRGFGPGDPEAALRASAAAFLDAAGDPDEVMPHQRGPLPVGVQLVFALSDLAVHHDDVAVAAGASYEPAADVVSVLEASYRRLGWWDEDGPPGWAGLVGERGP